MPTRDEAGSAPRMLRYSSEAALETLGGAFEDACKTMQEFQDVFIRELKRPSAPPAATRVPDSQSQSAILPRCHQLTASQLVAGCLDVHLW